MTDPGSRVAAVFEDSGSGDGITAQSPGCAVAISDHGAVVYARGFGLADLTTNVPISPTMRFDVGSVSKQFTAATILLLAQEGRLALSDDIHEYVPELPSYGHPMPLRDLIWMESGIADGAATCDLPEAGPLTQADFLVGIVKARTLDFVPGTRWDYASSNYFLLRAVVERVTGEPLAAVARRLIFAPLGMAATLFHSGLDPEPTGAARSYDVSSSSTLEPHYAPQGAQGPSGVYTNVVDLLRWIGNFSTGVVGGAAFLHAQLLPGPQTVPGTWVPDGGAYAAGLFLSVRNGRQIIWHRGVGLGLRAAIVYEPSRVRGVAVTCNTALRGNGDELAASTLDAWFGS